MKTNNTKDITKGYKGYNSDFTCRPNYTLYQYTENTICELDKDEELKCCRTGFHYCPNPLDVLKFYSLIGDNGELNVLTRVEALGNIDTDDNIKYATDKIKIGEKLSFNEYVKECIEYMKENCESEDISDSSKVAVSGNYSQVATSGYGSKVIANGKYSQVATSGNGSKVIANGKYSQVATSGNCSQIAVSGNYSQVATSGNCSQIAVSGNYSQVATSGECSHIATSGECSQVATNGYKSCVTTSGYNSNVSVNGVGSKVFTSGEESKAFASGYCSRVNVQGDNSVGVNIGINGKIKGVLGTWITLAEYEWDTSECICVKSAKIDGVILKADTWYKLKDGEFVEYC